VIGANRIVNREKVAGLDWYMTDRGIVLWVRVQSPEQEDAALTILSDHGAIAARVHEIEIDQNRLVFPAERVSSVSVRRAERPGETCGRGRGSQQSALHGRWLVVTKCISARAAPRFDICAAADARGEIA